MRAGDSGDFFRLIALPCFFIDKKSLGLYRAAVLDSLLGTEDMPLILE
jgi:hypothetical protein